MYVLAIHVEFYKMTSTDSTYAKMAVPILEMLGEIVASDDLDGLFSDLQSHMTTQLMKLVAILTASIATNREK